MTTVRCDVLVIGSGQGGNPFVGACAKAGRHAVLVERAHLGGTCVNEGCTPTKTMIASARVAYLARRAAEYGVDRPDVADGSHVHVDLARVRERKQEMVDSFRTGLERRLVEARVELIRGTARFVGERTAEVAGPDGVKTFVAEVTVINTGLRPRIPQIPGLDGIPYLTSTTIMELTELPEHLIVLGGGYVGLEFGQMFRRFGSRVTLLQRADQLLPREDADVAEEVARILREDGIDVVLQASVSSVRRDDGEVRVEYRSGDSGSSSAPPTTVTGTHLLVATGRAPNTHDLGLRAAGIASDEQGYVRVDDRLETTARGVYAVGDVKGGPAFTHISYDDFRILRRNLLQKESASTNGRLVPYTVFIDPQLGRIGMTEREAQAGGWHVRVAKLPMRSVARALEVGEPRGFMKALVDAESQRILGASVLGTDGGEIAALLQLAMMGDLPYTALRDGVFAHPTLAESMNNLFMALDRDS
jgi:pyruvate/2-oxoglutarate dehydrogenase complex dihydrolipoamide dehydrogenase (E3) component